MTWKIASGKVGQGDIPTGRHDGLFSRRPPPGRSVGPLPRMRKRIGKDMEAVNSFSVRFFRFRQHRLNSPVWYQPHRRQHTTRDEGLTHESL